MFSCTNKLNDDEYNIFFMIVSDTVLEDCSRPRGTGRENLLVLASASKVVALSTSENCDNSSLLSRLVATHYGDNPSPPPSPRCDN